jgi:GNAT superfamily N-acetyltransferase
VAEGEPSGDSQVRLAGADDIDYLNGLFALAFGEHWARDFGMSIEQLLADPDSRVFLYCLEGEAIGGVALTFEILHSLVFLPDHRGQNLGKELIRRVTEEVDWNGKPIRFCSIVDTRVPGAERRFRELGFIDFNGVIGEHFRIMVQLEVGPTPGSNP